MSPYSLRDDGWCQKELDYAIAHKNEKIALAKIYPDCHHPLEKEISQNYTFGDFTSDFEAGFRRLTEMFLGQAYSSWEALPLKSDIELLEHLKHGTIPGLIGKEIIEWVVVEKLFAAATEYALKQEHIFPAQPRTLKGILYGGTKLIEQVIQNGNFAAAQRTLEVMNIVQDHMDTLTHAADNEHQLIGQIAFDIIKSTHNILTRNATASGEMLAAIGINNNFNLDVAEKLRELIQLHARRSRYLY